MQNSFNNIQEDKIELLKQTQIEKKRVLIHTLKPERGHILFEFDLDKREVRRAKFVKPKEISYLDVAQGLGKTNKEVDGKDGCIYISALNEENAWKKFLKLF